MPAIKHAPFEACGNLIRTCRKADGSGGFLVAECSLNLDGASERAKLFAAAPDLLAELSAAHQIIRNALNLMTLEQKTEWAVRNAYDGVIGEGTTRANERDAVIAKATGAA